MDNNSVLFNKETGLAEAVPGDQAQQLLASKTHEFPLNDPEGNAASAALEDVPMLLKKGYTQPSNEQLQGLLNNAKNEDLSEQLKAGAEGFGSGLISNTATTAIEKGLLGAKDEDIERRAKTTAHTAGEIGGFLAPAILTGGTSLAAKAGLGAAESALPFVKKAAEYTLPGMLEKAGVGAAGLAGKAGIVSQIGQDAIKGAFEMGLISTDQKVADQLKDNPSQSFGSAMSEIGLNAVLGGVAGPIFGALGRKLGGGAEAAAADALGRKEGDAFVSQVDMPGVQAGDFKSTIENSSHLGGSEKKSIIDGLTEQKSNAPEIVAAANRIGAPVLEGMTSASKAVQRAEDSLINGAPTFSGLKRQALYNEGYQKAESVVNSALGEGSNLSKAELGNNFKSSITDQFAEQNAPIADLYNEIKKAHDVIPLTEDAASSLSKELEDIKEFRLSPSSPEGSIVKRTLQDIGNVKTVDDLKTFKTIVRQSVAPTASSGEKRMASVIADKLSELENNSIEQFAKNMAGTAEQKANISALIEKRKMADGLYKDLIGKVQQISEKLGKGRVYGVQDAINFINDLTPEAITDKLFSKKDSEFLSFFAKEFPDQMNLMQQYQKGILKDAAMKGEDFSLNTLFTKVNKLEPEVQRAIFTPEELSKIKDSETYIRSFPKNFNPSGTSHSEALREFFNHPRGAVLSNLRDYGMEKFIKTFGANPDIAGANSLGRATVNGYKAITGAVKSVLNSEKTMTAALMTVSEASRDKLKKAVDEYTKNPEKLMDLHSAVSVPEYQTAFAMTAARSVQYLASLRPNTDRQKPLDPKPVPNAVQEAKYNRALDIAEKPISVLYKMKKGSLTPDDVAAIKTMHPEVYGLMADKLNQEIIDHTAKGKSIPYAARLSMGLFLGQDLDSTMTPQAIMATQPQQAPGQPQQGGPVPQGGKAKGSMASLSKIPGMFMTPQQARQADKLKG